METDTGGDVSRNEYLFHHLVAMFQTLALQQLGKLLNPITGGVERDLQQARITIDMLQMIKDKTAGNLSVHERTLLDGALMELQLNYVDELNRGDQGTGAATEASRGDESGEETERGGGATETEAAKDAEGEQPGAETSAVGGGERGSGAAREGTGPKKGRSSASSGRRSRKAKREKGASRAGSDDR